MKHFWFGASQGGNNRQTLRRVMERETHQQKRSERNFTRGVGAPDSQTLAQIVNADAEGDHVSQNQ